MHWQQVVNLLSKPTDSPVEIATFRKLDYPWMLRMGKIESVKSNTRKQQT